MIRSIDVITFAARHGMVLRTDLTKQALQSIDREALEEEEAKHWEALVWDGSGDPPVSTSDRWLQDVDAIGRAAKEAAENPSHCMYFLMHDGKLHHFQPYVAYERGHIKIVRDDENHPYHHSKATKAHIDVEVEQAVDKQVLELAFEKALELHEQANIPVGVTTTQPRG